jgi:hypothetical protein
MARWQSWTVSALAAVALMLTGVNMYLFSTARSLQGEISARQRFIQQGAPPVPPSEAARPV